MTLLLGAVVALAKPYALAPVLDMARATPFGGSVVGHHNAREHGGMNSSDDWTAMVDLIERVMGDEDLLPSVIDGVRTRSIKLTRVGPDGRVLMPLTDVTRTDAVDVGMVAPGAGRRAHRAGTCARAGEERGRAGRGRAGQ